MNEKTISTLFELLDKYMVEVPIVQRDYAQGRQDEDTRMVRSNLLKDMKSAILRKTPPLDINFVYGKTENDKFIPIDGQQRLTTLFLLHLYAFFDDESKTELLNKFTYETRASSRCFLEKLAEKRKSVFTSELSPSKEIIDSEWFVPTWKYDPTIQSALVMLDEIKHVFTDVDNLAQCLLNSESKPIVFRFIEMKDLGMEDSLYIKLNARGKPLTPLENFKARLISRIQKLQLNLVDEFEKYFDGKWTDLFWSNDKVNFDKTYLTFFGVLLMNKGIYSDDANWSNRIDFDKIEEEIFETAFHVLNFLSDNPGRSEIYRLVFNALAEKCTYPDRVLFHAVTTYLYMAKGVDTGSFSGWIRIIQNLTLNYLIDDDRSYQNAIEGINKLTDNWDNLLEYFSQNGIATGFSPDQIAEEQKKAKIIMQDDDFARHIYKAEQHSYFSGQIRSALYYATIDDGTTVIETFIQYWDKISALFDSSKPKHGHLLRRALLAIGDYSILVGDYKTLCADTPREGSGIYTMKSLFSKHGTIVKQLLDTLNTSADIALQLQNIIEKSTIPKNDWRYCFVNFPILFGYMGTSYLRLRDVSGEIIIVPNKSSNGYNFNAFLLALEYLLRQKGLEVMNLGDLGTRADRYLPVKEFRVRFKNKKFTIKDETDNIIFETKTDDPISEVSEYLFATISTTS